jgi:hypothetical protein
MVFNIKFRADGPEIDVKKFERLLSEGYTRLWKDSIAEFVRAVALSNTIHVDTGMSVASVAPLGRQVRLFTQVMNAAGGGKPKAGGELLGQRGSKIQKSKAAGVRLGEDAYSIRYPTAQNQTMFFEFNIVVLQYFLHESSSNFSGSLNYETLDKGRTALRKYFLDNKFNPDYFPATEKWLRLRTWVK